LSFKFIFSRELQRLGFNLINVCVGENSPRFKRATNINQFRSEVLQAHNNFRRRHRAQDLQLSSNLNSLAQKWAEHLARIGQSIHEGDDYGENLSDRWSTGALHVSGHEIVKGWYDEIQYYDFNSNGGIQGAGTVP